MKDMARQAERLIRESVPRVGELLDRQPAHEDHLSDYIYARQVLEQIEVEFRGLKKDRAVLNERNGELQRILEVYQNRPGEFGQNRSAPQSLQPTIKVMDQYGGKADYDLKLTQARA